MATIAVSNVAPVSRHLDVDRVAFGMISADDNQDNSILSSNPDSVRKECHHLLRMGARSNVVVLRRKAKQQMANAPANTVRTIATSTQLPDTSKCRGYR